MPLRYLFNPWMAPEHVQKEAGCIIGEDYPHPIGVYSDCIYIVYLIDLLDKQTFYRFHQLITSSFPNGIRSGWKNSRKLWSGDSHITSDRLLTQRKSSKCARFKVMLAIALTVISDRGRLDDKIFVHYSWEKFMYRPNKERKNAQSWEKKKTGKFDKKEKAQE